VIISLFINSIIMMHDWQHQKSFVPFGTIENQSSWNLKTDKISLLCLFSKNSFGMIYFYEVHQHV
jgi:hypothetical protein